MSVLTTLRAARKLIEHEENWTQRVFARDNLGEPVAADSDQACCWCVSGAIGAVSNSVGTDHREATNEFRQEMGEFMLLGSFNDSHTHAEVLHMLDKTIARLEKAS